MRGEGGQKMSVFVHAQGIKTVHAGRWGWGWVEKWQNYVQVVEYPLCKLLLIFISAYVVNVCFKKTVTHLLLYTVVNV